MTGAESDGVGGTNEAGSNTRATIGYAATQVSVNCGRTEDWPGWIVNAPSRRSENICPPAGDRASSSTTHAVAAGTALRSFSMRQAQSSRQAQRYRQIIRA